MPSKEELAQEVTDLREELEQLKQERQHDHVNRIESQQKQDTESVDRHQFLKKAAAEISAAGLNTVDQATRIVSDLIHRQKTYILQ